MDVIFEIQRGKSFCVEIGFFDTVQEMKEKIQKYHGIPTSKQTLIFNGQVLPEDGDIWKCEIFHNSRIQLHVAPDHLNNINNNNNNSNNNNSDVVVDKPVDKTEDLYHSPAPTTTKIHLNVKTPSSKMHAPLEIDVSDTVSKLKEKIHDMDQTVPVNRMILLATGAELHDHQVLKDCDHVSDNAEIEVNFKPSPPPPPAATTSSVVVAGGIGGGSGSGSGGGSKKLKLMVLPKSGTKKIPIEMNATDNVGELRKELQKLHQRIQFPLPQEGYFFIYKQNVMDDDRSFRWHHVAQGDTIEIFNGSVTGGS
ncbi:hypothetical protein RIF29_16763 [Crotalaria pallida]|uniref:Ubiquitin-like domain-containing protein n=1 Tax=Crotalaria pallida TaxID=3830 RepID=A0AAN9FPB3_CROPI